MMELAEIECLTDAELDVLVAKKVMGFEVLGVAICNRYAEGDVGVDPDQEESGGSHEMKRAVYLAHCACDISEPGDAKIGSHHWGCAEVVPWYSTNIAHAFQVVEKMAPQWSEFYLARYMVDDKWHVIWVFDQYMNEVAADTIQRAICVAACYECGFEDAT